jgi:hypothetical protein
MNFTQSFDEFSRSVGPTDLMLYAGIGLVVWVLFKDKLSPVQSILGSLVQNVKNYFSQPKNVVVPPATNSKLEDAFDKIVVKEPENLFFKLIVSWKETRDLAVECGCDKAVEVADTMFPYLSPNVCGKEKQNVEL